MKGLGHQTKVENGMYRKRSNDLGLKFGRERQKESAQSDTEIRLVFLCHIYKPSLHIPDWGIGILRPNFLMMFGNSRRFMSDSNLRSQCSKSTGKTRTPRRS